MDGEATYQKSWGVLFHCQYTQVHYGSRRLYYKNLYLRKRSSWPRAALDLAREEKWEVIQESAAPKSDFLFLNYSDHQYEFGDRTVKAGNIGWSRIFHWFPIPSVFFQTLEESSKRAKYNWYHCHPHIFAFFLFQSLVHWNDKIHKMKKIFFFFLLIDITSGCLVVWSGFGDRFWSQSPRRFHAFNFQVWIQVCVYTVWKKGKNFNLLHNSQWITAPPRRSRA